MSLNLNDMMRKAAAKGMGLASTDNHPSSQALIRPWQQESTLFIPSEKTHPKPTTNQQQTNNKRITNQQQTDNKQTTKWQQKKVVTTKTGNKVATQPTTQVATNRKQTNNKPTTKNNFSSLVGLQRILVFFIYNECKIARSNTTESLTLEHISKTINATAGCIKTTLQRLEAKGFIEKTEYKNGRGGWSKYSIPRQQFQEILQYETDNKQATNWQQSDNKVVTQPTTQPTTNLSSSSGNIFNTTTTSDSQKQPQPQISMEWQNLDIEPLSEIGFSKKHLNQIASQLKLSPKEVQDSIYAFAFDLKENGKRKEINKDPISFFMGVLRSGGSYLPPSNYESPQECHRRLYAERMREIEDRNAAIEKETLDLAFRDWFRKLTDEQRKEFLPEMFRRNITGAKLENSKILESSARSHFEKELWQDIKNKIESGGECLKAVAEE
ncbi:MAG: hypothetical protein WCH10_06425 [bacterium]